MTRTMTTGDGIKLTTASTRRYVLFTIHEGKATVLRRSDKNGPCFAEKRAYFNRGGRCRTVVVDFVGVEGAGPKIIHDSAEGSIAPARQEPTRHWDAEQGRWVR